MSKYEKLKYFKEIKAGSDHPVTIRKRIRSKKDIENKK